MIARATCVFGFLLLLAPGVARGQDTRLTSRFPAPAAARLGGLVDSARREGLPTEPLVLRALEGEAKGASAEQIVAALSRLRDAMRVSRRVLGADAATSELTTAAAALQAGIPEARLTELHQLRAGRSVTAPLSAYLDLVSRGGIPEVAWDRITGLARSRASDADFGRLTPADVGARKPGRTGGGSSVEES